MYVLNTPNNIFDILHLMGELLFLHTNSVRMKQFVIRIGSILMLLLYLSYYISITSFYHTHQYAWGYIIHSHFYIPFEGNGNPVDSHQHTAAQFQAIALLSQLAFICLFAGFVLFAAIVVRYVFASIRRYTPHTHLIHSLLRAPPVFFYC